MYILLAFNAYKFIENTIITDIVWWYPKIVRNLKQIRLPGFLYKASSFDPFLPRIVDGPLYALNNIEFCDDKIFFRRKRRNYSHLLRSNNKH